MTDLFANVSGTHADMTAPANSAEVVTPHDSTNLAQSSRGLYVGVAGDVSVEMVDTGTAIVFSNLPVGIHPLRITRVNSTATTATNMVALY